MAITRFSGPIIAGMPQGSGDSNPVPGPSMFRYGTALLDERFYQPGGDTGTDFPCFYQPDSICVVDAAPSAISTTNISNTASPVANTPLTLAGASTGITVVPAGGFQLMPGMGTFPAGALMMDGNPGFIQLGTQGGGPTMYDPRTMVARAVKISSAGNDSSGTANIVGMDWYGQLIHETVTLTSISNVNTKRAYKAIISITPQGTLSGSAITVGATDLFGFNLAAYDFGSIYSVWNSITSVVAQFTAAVTGTATATSGDVRGTMAIVTTASDGTRKLQMYVSPQAWNLTTTGLYGSAQF